MTEHGYLVTHRDHLGPLRVRVHFRLDDGRRRAVIINRAEDTPGQLHMIGLALAGDNVVTKEEAKRRGWRLSN